MGSGLSGHVADRFDDFLFVWSLFAPFIAGMFAMRTGWIVPLAVVFGNWISQLLGGEHWVDFEGNEGPMILLLGLPFCMACFGLGWAVRGYAVVMFGRAQRPSGQPEL
jgi:hypothetical protein